MEKWESFPSGLGYLDQSISLSEYTPERQRQPSFDTHIKSQRETPAINMSKAPDANISTSDSLEYWNSIDATVNGMLGGYPQISRIISRIDLKGSANFLAKLRRQHPSSTGDGTLHRGVDCGAGIGRIMAWLLSTVCDIIDIVEPINKFAQEAKAAEIVGKGTLGEIYVTGLENWKPEQRYDLIWNQWCMGHLTDQQLVAYLVRCKDALTVDGWIIVKENMSTNPEGEDVFDKTDSSVTRTHQKFQQLFKEADIRLVKTEIQKGFPKGLYPVRLYALKSQDLSSIKQTEIGAWRDSKLS